MAGLLEGRYQVSFSVNRLQLILNSGSPGPGGDGGEVRLQLTWTAGNWAATSHRGRAQSLHDSRPRRAGDARINNSCPKD